MGRDEERPYLQAAIEAGIWIRSQATVKDSRAGWYGHSDGSKNGSLFNGTAGVVLFLLELFRATNDEQWLDLARAGAKELSAILEKDDCSLYHGAAGMGFALAQVAEVTGESSDREAVLLALDTLRSGSTEDRDGIHWRGITDVMSGSAGIGLFLLWLSKWLSDEEPAILAAEAARKLVSVAEREGRGLRWTSGAWKPTLLKVDSAKQFYMPNFSHGTAGIAFFVASVAKDLNDEPSLRAAKEAALYLQDIADVDPEGAWRVPHHLPKDEELHYLSFCHGPVGTSRLFYRLSELDPSGEWFDWYINGAYTLLKCGLPDNRLPGLWDNVGLCCGTAGVARFVLEAHCVTQRPEFRELAAAISTDILRRSTREADALKWVHAEMRVFPSELKAQPGYMHGAAGIGSWLLSWDAFLNNASSVAITLPDSPFGGVCSGR